MADPPTFDGSIKDSENFLSSLENIFDSQPSSFPTAESRIRYALTFLTGGASNWRKLLLHDVSEGRFSLQSWDAFEIRFRETFGNPHLLEEARRKLWTIKQGQRTSEDFFLEFEEIRLEADICENSLIMFLQAALRPSLLDEILRRDPQPYSYSEWKAATLKADHNQRNSAATRSFHSNSSHNTSTTRRQTTFLPFCPRHPPQTSNGTNLITAPPTSKTDSNNRLPTLPVSKDSLNSKAKTCWKCGKLGHISRECLENSANPKVRALFEQIDELDSIFETASSGAESIRKLLDSSDESIDNDCRTFLERFISDNLFFVEYDE